MKLELKHLAPYLPYGLQVNANDSDLHIENFTGEISSWEYYNTRFNVWNEYKIESHMVGIENIKPILRPLSSMTNDEATNLFKIVFKYDYLDEDFPIVSSVWDDSSISIKTGNFNRCRRIEIDVQDGVLSIKVEYNLGECLVGGAVSYNINEWLFKHHFDVFGLIDNDLAIDKTKQL